MQNEKYDYYDILKINKTATEKEIKKAYRELVLKYHPDRNPTKNKSRCENKFHKINEAYEILGNNLKRCEYDYLNIDDLYFGQHHLRQANEPMQNYISTANDCIENFFKLHDTFNNSITQIIEHVHTDIMNKQYKNVFENIQKFSFLFCSS